MEAQKSNKQNNLEYQKQLLGTLKKIVDFRTTLISEAAIISNDCKIKEWNGIQSQVKQIKKQVEKKEDINLEIIASLLKDMEEPILQLENNLELKNNFRSVIEEQSMRDKPEVAAA